MAPDFKNLEILVSPDTHSPLKLSEDGAALVTADGKESFPVTDGLLYLLPQNVLNRETKATEREGWKKVFQKHQWEATGKAILDLPASSDDPYWKKVNASFEFLDPLLGDLEGKRGLDLACGIGWASSKFASKGAKMIAADFNDTIYNGLSAAIKVREHGVNFDAVCCDSETLPIADNSLDFAFICSALHHFTDPTKALKDIHRVLKPGGMFIDICEAFIPGIGKPHHEEDHAAVLEEFQSSGINEQDFTQWQYEKMFKDAGFKDLLTLMPIWDEPNKKTPPHQWRNQKLRDRVHDHPRKFMRYVLKYARFPFVIAPLRWRLLYLTDKDRLFVATKQR